MISVMVKVTGSRAEVAEINDGGTVAQALDFLDYETEGFSIKVNGVAGDLETTLSEGQTVILTERVKGGLI